MHARVCVPRRRTWASGSIHQSNSGLLRDTELGWNATMVSEGSVLRLGIGSSPMKATLLLA